MEMLLHFLPFLPHHSPVRVRKVLQRDTGFLLILEAWIGSIDLLDLIMRGTKYVVDLSRTQGRPNNSQVMTTLIERKKKVLSAHPLVRLIPRLTRNLRKKNLSLTSLKRKSHQTMKTKRSGLFAYASFLLWTSLSMSFRTFRFVQF